MRLEFGKVPAGFASVVKPTVTIQTSANLAMAIRWSTGRRGWPIYEPVGDRTRRMVTLIVKLNQPNLPKTGY